MSESAVTETKVCRKCGVAKAAEEYAWRLGERRVQCKACVNAGKKAARLTQPRRPNKPAPVDGSKRCVGCAAEKSLTEFSPTPSGGRLSRCKACWYTRLKVWLSKRPPRTAPAATGVRVCETCQNKAALGTFPIVGRYRDGVRGMECKRCINSRAATRRWAARPRDFHDAPERFWKRVNKNGPIHPYKPELGPCWIYEGPIATGGYGTFNAGGTNNTVSAHRYAWKLEHGPIPKGVHVLHSCDRPPCVRHLRLGTRSENSRDMYERRRYPVRRGENATSAKLTAEKVRVIRERHDAGESQTVLAKKFGVTSESIHAAVRYKSWKHVI